MLTRQGFKISPLLAIGVLFFIFGFITWLCSVLIPYLQLAYELTNFQAQLVSFAFYISYFVMALPSGWVLKYTGFKNGISLGLFIMMIGSLCFIPGAIKRQYAYFLMGLFIQGTGLAVLQTAANPYVTILGPEESAARRMSIMGICSGIAGILAPIILGEVVLDNVDSIKAQIEVLVGEEKVSLLKELAYRVVAPYIVIASILLLLSLWFYKLSLPEPQPETSTEIVKSEADEGRSIFSFPHLIFGVISLFVYVGVEVIAGNTIIGYASWIKISLDTGKFFTSLTLLSMLIGYLVGIICIPRFFSQQFALKVSAVLGIVFTLLALNTNGLFSVMCVALLGLANSLMWPSIWPLALSDLGARAKMASSLLVMAIAGGALIPLVYGRLSDATNPKVAYWVVVPCYFIILVYAIYGYKIKRWTRGKGYNS